MEKTIVLLAVSALVLAMAPAAQAELVTHYKLDETSGTTASDATGNGNDGTVSSPNWEEPKAPPANAVSAVSMDAGDLLSGVAPVDADNAFTIMFWLKSNMGLTGGYRFMRMFAVGKDDAGAGTSELHFSVEEDGNMLIESYYYPGENNVHNVNPFSFMTDDWQHHAVAVDDLVVKWYIDGVERASGTMPSNVTSSEFYILGSAGTQGAGKISGSIDEVGVFDEALGQTAIQGFMNDGIAAGGGATPGTLISVQ